MRACIHRGSKQVGGSCVEVESCGQRLLIDLGLPLDSDHNHEKYLTDISGLDGGDPSLLGILISHLHLDHYGLLAHVSQDIPIGMGAAARRILQAASPFMRRNLPIPSGGWVYDSGAEFSIGPFVVTPFLVDHSAYDAYALLIESGGRRLFYSGDFRVHGRKSALMIYLMLKPPKNIDVLILEGTSLGRTPAAATFPTEEQIESRLVEVFSEIKGLALVHASGQNIDRIVSIFRACKRTRRMLIIDLYTAAILEATGNAKLPQSNWSDVALYVPHAQRIQIKEKGMFDLLNRHSSNRIFAEDLKKVGDRAVLLFRPLHRFDLEREGCLSNAVYIYSQWEGYWEQGVYDEIKKWMARHNIPKVSIHTSGHACPKDLKDFIAAIRPRKVVPIHSFHPDKYSGLFQNVEVHNDGEWWEV